METFRTTITPVLTIRQAAQAVVFYQRAFGAEEIYRSTYPDGRIVAELAIDGARSDWPMRHRRRPISVRRRLTAPR